jgi:hypothetical protein
VEGAGRGTEHKAGVQGMDAVCMAMNMHLQLGHDPVQDSMFFDKVGYAA